MNAKPIKIFSGSSHPALAGEIAEIVGRPLGRLKMSRFKNGEIYVKLEESVRGAAVFVVQSFARPINDLLVELLIVVDALRRSSAGEINVILPYYGYARQEKQDLPREPISAKVVADVLTAVGVSRVITIDLHAGAIQGFFNIPVDHLTALDLIVEDLKTHDLGDAVVVSPDAGRIKTAEALATDLDLPLAIMHKRRPAHNRSEVGHLIGRVRGKTPIIIEDLIDTGGTILNALEALLDKGARPDLRVYVTHGIFSEPAYSRLSHEAISEIVVTDTLPLKEGAPENIRVISVAPLLAEAILRIQKNQSLSKMFERSR